MTKDGSHLREAAPSHRPPQTLGLALGSGGAKGIAHVVALEALDELGVKPSIVAGSSIGAIAGACYAAGMSGREIREFLLNGIANPLSLVPDLLKCHIGGFQDLFTLSGNPVLLDAERVVGTFLPKTVPSRFEELRTPLVTVATEFYEKSQMLFESGDLRFALAASMAIPGLFKPVVAKGRVLVDGGLVNPLPFDLLVERAEFILAIDITGAPRSGDRQPSQIPSPLDALFASVQIMAHRILEEKLSQLRPTLLLRPAITNFRTLDFLEAKKILKAAEPLREEVKRGVDMLMRNAS